MTSLRERIYKAAGAQIDRVNKAFEFKGALDDDGTITGAASVTGVMDRSGDVILPGAFKSALKGFLANGFVPTGHDWDYQAVVAYPISAKETGNQLMCSAKFHGTEDAQAIRQKCVERIEAGLSIGLSVGFRPDPSKCAWYENGKAMLDACEKAGCDMSLMDTKTIKAYDGWCRSIGGVAELFEFSIVPVGMNPKAVVTEVKGYTAQQQFDEALDALVLAIEREADIATLRGKVSDSQRERLLKAVSTLESVLTPATALDADVKQEPDESRAERIAMKMARAASIAR